jgi:hypothetical protein
MNVCLLMCTAYELVIAPQFEQKLASIKMSLRDRMRFYKLQVNPNGSQLGMLDRRRCF